MLASLTDIRTDSRQDETDNVAGRGRERGCLETYTITRTGVKAVEFSYFGLCVFSVAKIRKKTVISSYISEHAAKTE